MKKIEPSKKLFLANNIIDKLINKDYNDPGDFIDFYMTIRLVLDQAFENGYEKGLEDAKDSVKALISYLHPSCITEK